MTAVSDSQGTSDGGAIVIGDQVLRYRTTGGPAFAQEMSRILSVLSRYPSGRRLMEGLIASGMELHFVYDGNRFNPQAKRESAHLTSITLNPFRSYQFRTQDARGRRRPKDEDATFVLAHEMHHAWHYSGEAVRLGRAIVGPPLSEAYAIRYTNLIRREADVGYVRTHWEVFGGNPVDCYHCTY
jgi:hypothetical protein